MKYLFLSLCCLLPFATSASMLGDCDSKPYDIIIRNGGAERHTTITPYSGEIQEYGPDVSYQIKGQPPVIVRERDAEYCIWHGKITIQRINTWNSSGGGASLR